MSARDALDGMKARLAGATPGPWAVEHDNADDYEAGIFYGDYPCCIRGPLNVSLTASDLEKPFWQDHKNRISEVSEMGNGDAEFIAAAPTDVSRLIGAVEAVLGECDYLDTLADGDKHYAAGFRAAIEGALNPKEAQ